MGVLISIQKEIVTQLRWGLNHGIDTDLLESILPVVNASSPYEVVDISGDRWVLRHKKTHKIIHRGGDL